MSLVITVTGKCVLVYIAVFAIRPTAGAQTKGIWVYAMPHPKEKNCCVLLMDAAGFDDDNNLCDRVFKVSIMRSVLI